MRASQSPNPCPFGTFGIPPADALRGQEECRKQSGIGTGGARQNKMILAIHAIRRGSDFADCKSKTFMLHSAGKNKVE